jgi:hypothetical protein
MKPEEEKALIDFLHAWQGLPFVWGKNDCCLFACNSVLAVTGIDPGWKYRDLYTTELGALKALKKHGGGDIKTAFTQVFGPIKPRLNAENGDLVLIDTELGDAVGVVQSCKVWAVSPAGLVSLPISQAKGCWKLTNMREDI